MQSNNTRANNLARRFRLWVIRARERLLQRDSIALLEQWEASPLLDVNAVRRRAEDLKYIAALYAYRNSPYYRRAFLAAGIDEQDLQDQRGWDRIPLLEKEDIRQNLEQIYSKNYSGPCQQGRTSGSTGIRLVFDVNRGYPVYSMAAARRGFRWWGVEPGAKLVRIWGTYQGIDQSLRFQIKTAYKSLIDRACGVTSLSAFAVTDPECHQTIDKIAELRPEVVFGYGTALFLVADYALRSSLVKQLASVRLVVYTSEYLTAWQRNRISEAFSCPVVSEYGSVETGVIAYDCPCGLQHIAQEFLDLEVLGEDGIVRPTGKGEAVVTHFFGLKLPLIRYRLGDVIEIVETSSPCRNGMVGKSIASLFGRNNDIIVSPAGNPLHPELFDYVMRTVSGIKRFQIREGSPGQLTIFLEACDGIQHESLAAQVAEVVKAQVGKEFQVLVSVVDRIQEPASGKFRWVIGNPANNQVSGQVARIT
ncbi:MAG: hypothetical protein NT169_20910 [Chloroflexi bacterium]|nr:hypothetical protein [Chloroflexota bacterium]